MPGIREAKGIGSFVNRASNIPESADDLGFYISIMVKVLKSHPHSFHDMAEGNTFFYRVYCRGELDNGTVCGKDRRSPAGKWQF